MSQATKRTARQKHSFGSSNKSAAIDHSRRFFLCELVGELNLAFDSQIRAHNLEIKSYGVSQNAFGSIDILWIHDYNYVPEGVCQNNGLGHNASFQCNSVGVAAFTDSKHIPYSSTDTVTRDSKDT